MPTIFLGEGAAGGVGLGGEGVCEKLFWAQASCCLSAAFVWRHLRKMAGIEKVVTARYIKEVVEVQGKTHRKVSDILRQEHPGIDGLSERSVRRYCATNGIRRHDSRLTNVDDVIASAIAEVSLVSFYNIKTKKYRTNPT